MNAKEREELKAKLRTELESENSLQERVFALIKANQDLRNELRRLAKDDDLDYAFRGEDPPCKSSAYKAVSDKLDALISERKTVFSELQKTQREIVHLRETLTLM